MDNFEKVMDHILKMEGGYVDNSLDKGGPTNFGITQATYSAFLGRPASVTDVRNMQTNDAVLIYKKSYWDKMNLSYLKSFGTQLILMDQGVNRGPKTAVMQAQVVAASLGVKLTTDGELGNVTGNALNGLREAQFNREYLQASIHSYVDIVKRNLSQIVFLSGWVNRVQALEDKLWDGTETVSEIPAVKPVDVSPQIPSANSSRSILDPYFWAQKELGQSEIVGRKNNARIVYYHSFTTLHATDDETAWCSSFMCAAAENTGFKSTRSAAAWSWKDYGVQGTGTRGDIAVLTHPDGTHHVTFVNKDIRKGDQYFEALGGNQSNMVKVSNFAMSEISHLRRFVA